MVLKGPLQLEDYVPDATKATRGGFLGLGGVDALVNIDPNVLPVLWEIDPSTGGAIAAPVRFDVLVWHEVVGHGLPLIENAGKKGTWEHPTEISIGDDKWVSNDYSEKTAGSGAYDPVIKTENLARECLRRRGFKVRDRVHRYGQYWEVDERGNRRWPSAGERRAYSGE